MTKAKKFFAFFLVLVTIFSCMVFPASAATSSSGTSTRTITVVTKANWLYPGSESITLSQSKGTFTYTKYNGKAASKSEHGTWNITVSSTDGSHYFSKTWNDGSIKLNLKPNKTYKISVSYNQYVDTIRSIDYLNFRWTKYPAWQVKSTHKVSNYY